MKALTIQQPWAGLIACGVKRIENRTWTTSHRGRIAIHAAGKVHARGQAEQHQFHRELEATPGCLGMSRIVAVATLCNVIHVADIPDDLRGDQFAEGPFCWIFADVIPLSEKLMPLVKGSLGLWNLTDEQSHLVEGATRSPATARAPR
jgi:activating signal cointegrator 1